MAECKWPAGCKEGPKGKPAPAVNNSKFCDKHRRKAQEGEKDKQQKEQAEKAQKERDAKQLEMAELAKAKEEELKAKAVRITKIAAAWNKEVQAVVLQVKHLRENHPEAQNINAGHNHNIGNTEGGTDSPIAFTLPSDAKGITKADVFSIMAGFDGSDSGICKIRIKDPSGNILVHIK